MSSHKDEIARFGEKLLTLRERRGWTQRELAKKLNINHVTIGHIERGTNLPSLPMLLRITNVFGVSADVLIRDELELE